MLIGADVGLRLAHCAANELLPLGANLDVGVRIEIHVDDVAVFKGDLQAIGIVAIDSVVTEILYGVALFFVVHQRAIEVGVFADVAQIVFTEHLRIAASLKW